MKLLAIHGIGHQEADLSWQPLWQGVFTDGIKGALPAEEVTVEFLNYDDLFTPFLEELDAIEFAKAAFNLGSSALSRSSRGLFDLSDSVKWFVGMVVVFVNNEDLRASCATSWKRSSPSSNPTSLPPTVSAPSWRMTSSVSRRPRGRAHVRHVRLAARQRFRARPIRRRPCRAFRRYALVSPVQRERSRVRGHGPRFRRVSDGDEIQPDRNDVWQ